MRVRVLGCSGGVGQDLATTSFLVDDDILIDAGSGVCDLSFDEMRRIKHVFITHSHLDHIAAIPLLTDTLFEVLTQRPLLVHALPETIKAMQDHIFNWTIWPDFTELPNKEEGVLKLQTMNAGELIEIDGRKIEMVSVNHAVPGVGYCIESNGHVFAYSGDTTSNENFWNCLNRYDSLDLLFVECAYPDSELQLANLAYHYCPQLLAADMARLKHNTRVCLSHLKPGSEQEIVAQCKTVMPDRDIYQLKNQDVFQL